MLKISTCVSNGLAGPPAQQLSIFWITSSSNSCHQTSPFFEVSRESNHRPALGEYDGFPATANQKCRTLLSSQGASVSCPFHQLPGPNSGPETSNPVLRIFPQCLRNMLSKSLHIHPAVFYATDRPTALTEARNQRDSMQDAEVLFVSCHFSIKKLHR